MRMERLKEENAAATATATAAVTSPPVSFAGSTSASPPFLPQVGCAPVEFVSRRVLYCALFVRGLLFAFEGGLSGSSSRRQAGRPA